MSETAEVGSSSGRGTPGRSLVVLAALSVPLAVVWSAGILVAIVIAFVAVVRMPIRPAPRRLHWAALGLASIGTALSVVAGLATGLVGT